MPREYGYDMENQAKAVGAVFRNRDSESFEVNLCQLLLGMTERLEALVDTVDQHRGMMDENFNALAAAFPVALGNIQAAILSLQGK